MLKGIAEHYSKKDASTVMKGTVKEDGGCLVPKIRKITSGVLE